MSDALYALADAKGILPVFYDIAGNAYHTGDDTRRALLKAMGMDVSSDESIQHALDVHNWLEGERIAPREYVVSAGQDTTLPLKRQCDFRLTSETGELFGEGWAGEWINLPALPVGVYELEMTADGSTQKTFVFAAPAQTPTVQDGAGADRVWGATAALYGLKSKRNLGLGDYSDLAKLATVLGQQGASFLGINPIHNWGWANPDVISPYSPSHRGFVNTTHIAVDNIPGLRTSRKAKALIKELTADLQKNGEIIDYPAVNAGLRPLFKALFELFQSNASKIAKTEFAAFVSADEDDLKLFAAHEILATQYGDDWRTWPSAYRVAADVDLSAFEADDMLFHIWLQWVASTQIQQVSQQKDLALGLYLDLAVGPRRFGAETWMSQDSVAEGVAIGAPPDHLGPDGQNWQLAAFDPVKSSATGYRNFRNILRRSMKPAGVLRIDHVLGLARSFWIPDDGSPGGYVRQPFETLLALIGIEAYRAGCIVVGEDLGLVPDGFREALASRGLYGYSVLQYEKTDHGTFRDADQLRAQTLSCFSTHDTPTVLGFCHGRDIEWWDKLDLISSDTAADMKRARAHDVAALVPEGQDSTDAIHARLAYSPVTLAAVQLDDIAGEIEAQNLPGTIDEHPNWRRVCSIALDDLPKHKNLKSLSRIMQDAGRHCPTS